MSERLRNIVTIGLIVIMAVTLATLVATSSSEADRVESIGNSIKCPVCQGESIANSPSQMARDMMALVEERVADGASDDAIMDELLFSYSGAVLLDPPASGATLVLWIAPLAAVVLGVGIILWWRRHPTDRNWDDQGRISDQSVSITGGANGPEQSTSRVRRLGPMLGLGAAFAVIVVVAGFFLQDREGPASGVADIAGQDLEEVSNETMEAVIDANADHPEVDGMRLALAERYYEEGDFRSAFPHYLAVAESSNATAPQAVTSLIRLGWMAWQGNGEADAALDLFDQALALDADSDTARYLKAQVLWCGSGEFDEAAALLEEILADPDLADDSRDLIESDLTAIGAGRSCG